ncbi:MAG: hypothetical protein CM15mP122_4000 [Bacteroidota bacterium]|nr:MAG: hypothetical protein CM15mP122_4000 [Bacteroidota bacterium]
MGMLFSQGQDVSIGAISIVGGEPLCPSDSVKFSVEIINNDGANPNDVQTDFFYFRVNGPINRAPSTYQISATANILPSSSQTLIFPDDFSSVAGSSLAPLDLSNPGGPYTITASITIPDDPDISNNVSTSLDIVVFTPATPKLESNKDPGNVICAGDPYFHYNTLFCYGNLHI